LFSIVIVVVISVSCSISQKEFRGVICIEAEPSPIRLQEVVFKDSDFGVSAASGKPASAGTRFTLEQVAVVTFNMANKDKPLSDAPMTATLVPSGSATSYTVKRTNFFHFVSI
jgi:hypothetical protein